MNWRVKMGRQTQVAGGRPIVVGVRLTLEEKRTLDQLRGSLSPSVYLRLLLTAARKRNGI